MERRNGSGLWSGCLLDVSPVFRAYPTRRRPQVRSRTRWRDHISPTAWERLGVCPENLLEAGSLLKHDPWLDRRMGGLTTKKRCSYNQN